MNSSAFKRGKCDQHGRPGTRKWSKLFYINSWATIWPSFHLLTKKEEPGGLLLASGVLYHVHFDEK
jgi:hypothetical protein